MQTAIDETYELEDNICVDINNVEVMQQLTDATEDPKEYKTEDWIKDNPPTDREVSTVYSKRYFDEFKGRQLCLNAFSKLVENAGYYKIRGTKYYHWKKS
jgi:hypothetical protein